MTSRTKTKDHGSARSITCTWPAMLSVDRTVQQVQEVNWAATRCILFLLSSLKEGLLSFFAWHGLFCNQLPLSLSLSLSHIHTHRVSTIVPISHVEFLSLFLLFSSFSLSSSSSSSCSFCSSSPVVVIFSQRFPLYCKLKISNLRNVDGRRIDRSFAIASGANNARGLYNLFESKSFDIPDRVFPRKSPRVS